MLSYLFLRKKTQFTSKDLFLLFLIPDISENSALLITRIIDQSTQNNKENTQLRSDNPKLRKPGDYSRKYLENCYRPFI
jgi:hypothetical protein